jgi:hypothetical protein
MKKTIILFCLFLSFGISAQEIFVLQPVNIDPADSEKFEMIEKKYATIMAQKAKEDGVIKNWYLMKKSSGGRVADKALYIWVHVYENLNQMSKAGNWWETKDKFGVPASEIYDGVTRYPVGSFMYKTEKSIDTGRAGKYVIFNWAAPTDMVEAISLADKISNSFKGNMKKSGMTSWGMATRVYPQGEEFDPMFFWDGYETREQALAHLMNQGVLDVVKPEMFAELYKVIPKGFTNRVIMEAVTGTN